MGDDFCYYCGFLKPLSGAEEHVLPSAIGGNKNVSGNAPSVLVTTQVCDACNSTADKKIDGPFAREQVIAAARAFFGAPNRGKMPVFPIGRIAWDRPEVVDLFGLGSFLLAVIVDGGGRRLVEYYCPDPTSDSDTMKMVDKVCRTLSPDAERLGAAAAMDNSLGNLHSRLTTLLNGGGSNVRTTTLHDETVVLRESCKIALGVCCGLSRGFVSSRQAQDLRAAAFHGAEDSHALSRIPAKVGHFGGFSLMALGPGSSGEHLLRLQTGANVATLSINYYGQVPVALELLDPRFGKTVRGKYEWVIDPVKKTTQGSHSRQ